MGRGPCHGEHNDTRRKTNAHPPRTPHTTRTHTHTHLPFRRGRHRAQDLFCKSNPFMCKALTFRKRQATSVTSVARRRGRFRICKANTGKWLRSHIRISGLVDPAFSLQTESPRSGRSRISLIPQWPRNCRSRNLTSIMVAREWSVLHYNTSEALTPPISPAPGRQVV